VLALTPVPLQTAGERALFHELTRWDTGASVRAAVVASIPLVDGPMERRLSDAVLFVPEGLAVVRVVDVVRQSGVVTAKPEGPWTIGPAGEPGAVLQLSGGGSSPLDGLMRAGMDTAQKLRRAGLEPGRIARLTVLSGEVSGLVPEDGDLGEGDQVALLEPRSLLLGIARASRYTAVDNPRLWTTADVRAALEALGLHGRGPSVDQLNGEGFPYSPYVLRRPELLTPAAMAANPPAAGPVAPTPPAATPPAATPPAGPAAPVREQPSPAAIAQAVAASAAAAHAATPASWTPGAPAQPQRDTVAVDGPAAPPDDNGIGGLFARAEPEAAPSGPPRTAVFPVSQPPAAASAPAQPSPAQPFSYWTEQSLAGAADDEDSGPGSGRRAALMVLAGMLAVVILVVGGWWLLRDGPGGSTTGTAAGSTSAGATVGGPAVGTVQTVDGVDFTVQAVDDEDTCVGHAYGDTAGFFADNDCTGLSRALYSTEVGGQAVVVAVSRVRMGDAASARDLQSLTRADGTGNVSDLLREGVRYTGSPAELHAAREFASALSGTTVTIVETSWVDKNADGSSADLDHLADQAVALKTPPFPAK
jgi:hypothetical protein